jgi:Sec-independent protein secretion pathway component TatC
MQNKWWEGFAVLWLGLPLLITAFVAYPALLCLVRAKLAPAWTPLAKRWATAFAICSGSLFFLGGISGLMAWQHGVALTLRGFEPLIPPATLPTVSACFVRCAGSILEFGILAQIPVLAVFMARLRSSY